MVVVPTTQKCHVAILPSPGLGHIIPLLQFSKTLVTHHGVHVSFIVVTTTEAASIAEDKIFNSALLPAGLDVIKIPPVDVTKIATEENHLPIVTTVSAIIEESYKSLTSLLDELDPLNAVVIDMFTTKALEICNRLSVPAYSFYTCSTTFLALGLYLPTLDPETDGNLCGLTEPLLVPGCSPVQLDDLSDMILLSKTDEYKWYLHHASKLTSVDGILANSWEDLEPVSFKAIKENPFYNRISTPPVYPIGPMIKHSEPLMSSTDIKCIKWLDEKPDDSVLLVALGSGGTLSIEQMVELAFGLELSQQRFIWVVRKPTTTTGSGTYFSGDNNNDDEKVEKANSVDSVESYLPAGFVERTRGVGLVVASWVPQVEVLRHDATGGFLTHCGWNSSLESVSNGVPMIVCPLYAEQTHNATLLEAIGVAVKPNIENDETKIIGRKEIERVVRMVMESEKGKNLRCKTKALKESATQALGLGGCSYDSLRNVVEKWKLRSTLLE